MAVEAVMPCRSKRPCHLCDVMPAWYCLLVLVVLSGHGLDHDHGLCSMV